MTPEQQAQLQTINTAVNAIPYDALPGKGEPSELWTNVPIPGDSFVCRDYVQAKADALKAAGWPAEALTTILCYTESIPPREYHAVLCVEIDGETIILDSRIDQVYPMSSPAFDYLWDKRQVAGTTGFASIAST